MRPRLDPHSDRPLYRQVADVIRNAISTREYRPGVTLPTIRRLAADYEVGIDTVRHAIEVLRSEGLVTTSRGGGTHVARPVEGTVKRIAPGAQIRVRMPSEAERRELGASEGRVIPEGVPVLEITRDGVVEVLPGDRVVLETVNAV